MKINTDLSELSHDKFVEALVIIINKCCHTFYDNGLFRDNDSTRELLDLFGNTYKEQTGVDYKEIIEESEESRRRS